MNTLRARLPNGGQVNADTYRRSPEGKAKAAEKAAKAAAKVVKMHGVGCVAVDPATIGDWHRPDEARYDASDVLDIPEVHANPERTRERFFAYYVVRGAASVYAAIMCDNRTIIVKVVR